MADNTVTGGFQLRFVSATQIKLVPLNGDNIQIAGIIYPIPSAGVNAANTGIFIDGIANSNLAASTLYYVYLFSNNGTLTIDYSTTGHVSDTTAGNVGIEIKSGDNTRSLIGMIFTNSSSQFVDSATNRSVASWFNRRQRTSSGKYTANHSITSSTLVEINTEIRAYFLTWGDQDIVAHADVSTFTDASASVTTGAFGLDSGLTAFGGAVNGSFQPNNSINMNMSAPYPATEGYHFITLLGKISSGTGTWQALPQSGLLYVLSSI